MMMGLLEILLLLGLALKMMGLVTWGWLPIFGAYLAGTAVLVFVWWVIDTLDQ